MNNLPKPIDIHPDHSLFVFQKLLQPNDNQHTKTDTWKVKDPLGKHEANGEEDIRCGKKWENQERKGLLI